MEERLGEMRKGRREDEKGSHCFFGSTEVDGPNAEKTRRTKLKHSFQLVRVKGRHR